MARVAIPGFPPRQSYPLLAVSHARINVAYRRAIRAYLSGYGTYPRPRGAKPLNQSTLRGMPCHIPVDKGSRLPRSPHPTVEGLRRTSTRTSRWYREHEFSAMRDFQKQPQGRRYPASHSEASDRFWEQSRWMPAEQDPKQQRPRSAKTPASGAKKPTNPNNLLHRRRMTTLLRSPPQTRVAQRHAIFQLLPLLLIPDPGRKPSGPEPSDPTVTSASVLES